MSPIRLHPFIIASPFVLAVLWALLPAHDQVTVIDGDTLIVKGERIRLHGIDAPEREQVCLNANGAPYSCGQVAAARLRKEIKSSTVGCVALYHDVYRRQVATCTVGSKDLGDVMVRSGWALDFSLYSNGKYLAAETEARNAKRGLWAGEFDEPRRWRLEHPLPAWRR